MKKHNIIDDGFRSDLVVGASWNGILEFPEIQRPEQIRIPSKLIPFSAISRSKNHEEAVHFYEHDKHFSEVLTCTDELLPKLKAFSASFRMIPGL